jgi:hypothetical protein
MSGRTCTPHSLVGFVETVVGVGALGDDGFEVCDVDGGVRRCRILEMGEPGVGGRCGVIGGWHGRVVGMKFRN